MLESALLILLGWLLGILGGPITGAIDNERRARRLREALRAELSELRQLMAALAFQLHMFRGTVDQALLEWLADTWNPEGEADPNGVLTTTCLAELRLLSEVHMKRLPELVGAERGTLQLKRYSLPLLESSLDQVSLLEADERRQILAIRERLEIMNQDVPRVDTLHSQTFSNDLDPNNRRIVEANLDKLFDLTAERSVELANRIGELLDSS